MRAVLTEMAVHRKRLGLTQKEMARELGFHWTTLSLIECKRLVPNQEHKERILKVYKREEKHLFDDSGLAR